MAKKQLKLDHAAKPYTKYIYDSDNNKLTIASLGVPPLEISLGGLTPSTFTRISNTDGNLIITHPLNDLYVVNLASTIDTTTTWGQIVGTLSSQTDLWEYIQTLSSTDVDNYNTLIGYLNNLETALDEDVSSLQDQINELALDYISSITSTDSSVSIIRNENTVDLSVSIPEPTNNSSLTGDGNINIEQTSSTAHFTLSSAISNISRIYGVDQVERIDMDNNTVSIQNQNTNINLTQDDLTLATSSHELSIDDDGVWVDSTLLTPDLYMIGLCSLDGSVSVSQMGNGYWNITVPSSDVGNSTITGGNNIVVEQDDSSVTVSLSSEINGVHGVYGMSGYSQGISFVNDGTITFSIGGADTNWNSNSVNFQYPTKITNVATPTNSSDAANKAYVDSHSGISSVAWGQITGDLSNQADLYSSLSNLSSGVALNTSNIAVTDSLVQTLQTDFNNLDSQVQTLNSDVQSISSQLSDLDGITGYLQTYDDDTQALTIQIATTNGTWSGTTIITTADSTVWGGIQGDLSNQTDLYNALSNLSTEVSTIVPGDTITNYVANPSSTFTSSLMTQSLSLTTTITTDQNIWSTMSRWLIYPTQLSASSLDSRVTVTASNTSTSTIPSYLLTVDTSGIVIPNLPDELLYFSPQEKVVMVKGDTTAKYYLNIWYYDSNSGNFIAGVLGSGTYNSDTNSTSYRWTANFTEDIKVYLNQSNDIDYGFGELTFKEFYVTYTPVVSSIQSITSTDSSITVTVSNTTADLSVNFPRQSQLWENDIEMVYMSDLQVGNNCMCIFNFDYQTNHQVWSNSQTLDVSSLAQELYNDGYTSSTPYTSINGSIYYRTVQYPIIHMFGTDENVLIATYIVNNGDGTYSSYDFEVEPTDPLTVTVRQLI